MTITEFYVSCNPPLLPKGVASIFANVEERKNDLGIAEILYEPGIPWFKIICQGTSQREISSWMHSLLEELIENEAGAIVQDDDEDAIVALAIQPDIEVLVEEPHIIPFPSLQTIHKDIVDQYDEFRYPYSIKNLTYKAVWSVPELCGASITQILANYESLGPVSPSGPSTDSLQALTSCTLTHNLQGSLIYIGSDKSEQELFDLKQKLDTLAEFMDVPLAPTAHMIFTETPGSVDLCYRYLTHTGLSKLTYVDSPSTGHDQEYASIASATSLRIESVNQHRQPVPGYARYPAKTGRLTNWHPDFKPFRSYSYSRKCSGTPPIVNESKRPLQCSQHYHSENASKIASSKFSHSSKPASLSASFAPRGSPKDQDSRSQSHEAVTTWLGSVEHRGDVDYMKAFSCSAEGDDKQNPGEAEYMPSSSSETPQEVDGPKAPQAAKNEHACYTSANVQQQTPTWGSQTSLVPPLVDLDSPEELELLNFPNSSHPNINGRQDLMDISDDYITTPKLMDEARIPGHSNRPEYLPEAQSTFSEVNFGKTDDQKKDLFYTMRQKVAPGQSWANIAAKQGSEKQDNKTFGQDSRVTVVSGSLSTALIPVTSTPKEDTDVNPQVPRIVPGMDMPTMDQEQYDKIVSQAEDKLRNLVEVLRVTPGKVSIEAHFGRLCRKDISPALVYENQVPSWPVRKIVEALNTENPPMGFYPLLTTSGAEANLIPEMFSGKASWKLTQTRVFYEFLCVAEKTYPVLVEVDAATFRYQCFPSATELSKAFVHCTRRAWDVKFSMSRIYMEGIDDDMEMFAASLVRSMSIETNEMGEIVIDVKPKSAPKRHIDRVLIRHEATYRDGEKGPSYLKVTMTRRVERLPGVPKGSYRGQSVPVAPPGNGQPSQWFEARICSIRAEEIFRENMRLEFGEKTHWTPETLQKQGVFKAICEPTMKMVSKMDQVGDSNDNGHGPRTDQPSYNAVQVSMDRQRGVYFW
ncbi:hypothetical protein FBEOM_10913 [Fusarium beomiforme]|uniref:Uncharacterized protein n=1 Tax=Fusarium beomiforme TaxID=44412 RepID=A0A9P5DUW6_9HYPO|nr:hypothetical protein FBEOM_10913 [Fusarium beomiforme]